MRVRLIQTIRCATLLTGVFLFMDTNAVAADAGNPSLTGFSLRGGPRGLVLTLAATGPLAVRVDSDGVKSRERIELVLAADSRLGRRHFNRDRIPADVPVKAIEVAEEKGGSQVRIRLDLEIPASARPRVLARKRGSSILLSTEPAAASFWRMTPPVPSPVSAASVTPPLKAAVTTSVAPEHPAPVARLEDLRAVRQPGGWYLAAEFDARISARITKAASGISIVCTHARNGLGKTSYRFNKAVAPFSTVKIVESGGEKSPSLKITVKVRPGCGRLAAFTENKSVILSCGKTVRDDAFGVWSVARGNEVYHLFAADTQKVDYQYYKNRAQTDIKRPIGPGDTFSIHPVPAVADKADMPPASTPVRKRAPEASAAVARPSSEKPPPQSVAPPPAVVEYDTTEAVIAGSRVNMRSSPRSNSRNNILGKLSEGTAISVLEQRGEWSHISVDGRDGWVHSSLVREPAVKQPVAVEPPPAVEVSAPSQPEPAAPPAAKPKSPVLPPAPVEAAAQDRETPARTAREDAPPGKSKQLIAYHVYGRDPFLPLSSEDENTDDMPKVENLSLVGVLLDDRDRIALVEDHKNAGRAYALRENDPVFKGRVLRIAREKVVFLISEFGIARTYALKLEKERNL